MTVLDLSKNLFSDYGFVHFAKQLAFNKGLESLNL
jgi:Ran GTPase-activating protein (RanGAP) involved in mRNA processing and transport